MIHEYIGDAHWIEGTRGYNADSLPWFVCNYIGEHLDVAVTAVDEWPPYSLVVDGRTMRRNRRPVYFLEHSDDTFTVLKWGCDG